MESITVNINRKEITLDKTIPVSEAVKRFGIGRSTPAVWINGKSIKYQDYATHLLQDGDNIKIIRISGGG